MPDNDSPKRKTPPRQRDGQPPIVDNPKSHRMGERDVRPRRIDRRIVQMPEEPPERKAKKNTMDKVPPRKKRATALSQLEDQVPVAARAADEEGPGYIRFSLRVEDGQLSVQSAKFVAGPLRQVEPVSPGLTYEAKVGRRRVAYGDVPDSTQWRSYPDPEGRAGMDTHHIVEQDSYDVTVRIPADEVDEDTIGGLRVSLYRWRGAGPGEHLEMRQLADQPKAALEEVATMKGVDVGALPQRLRADLRSAFRAAGR